MMEMIDTFIDTTLQSLGVWGPIVGCFFITIESILPFLPLFVFITLNFLAFGPILGFITIDIITNLKFEQLTTIIAIPFTPAFLVNIAAGLSNMSYKKFLGALLIGKIFLVYFWGFVGVSLLESIKNPIYLVRVGILLIIAYIVSKIVNKKFNLN